MALRGQTTGGYPQSTTVGQVNGLMPILADVDFVPALKAQEVALNGGTGKMQSNFLFEITNFSIRVSEQTWLIMDSGTEIPIDESDGFVPFDCWTRGMKFKTPVSFKIAYTF